jgi:hypothetical protein
MSFIKSTIECRQSSFCGRGRAIAADVQAYPDAHRRSANLARIPNGLELFVVEPAVARRRITDDSEPLPFANFYIARGRALGACKSGSLRTPRWREPDSNSRSPFGWTTLSRTPLFASAALSGLPGTDPREGDRGFESGSLRVVRTLRFCFGAIVVGCSRRTTRPHAERRPGARGLHRVRLGKWDQEFESSFLQRRVRCEPPRSQSLPWRGTGPFNKSRNTSEAPIGSAPAGCMISVECWSVPVSFFFDGPGARASDPGRVCRARGRSVRLRSAAPA